MTININKPLEYNFGSIQSPRWTPARLVCTDRKSKCGNTHAVLYTTGSGSEDVFYCTAEGVDGISLSTTPRLRNVAEKKKFWTVTMVYTPNGSLYPETRTADPLCKVGDTHPTWGTAYKVINIVEGEYESV